MMENKPSLELSIKDRLLISYQLGILGKLNPEKEEYYANQRIAIEKGYELQYNEIIEHINPVGLTTAECHFVYDVLNLHVELRLGFNRISETTNLTLESIKFNGFDHLNEGAYLGYCTYILDEIEKDDDRYDIIRETTHGEYDNHTNMIPRYKKMVEIWKKGRIDIPDYYLPEKLIHKIISTN